MAQHLRIVGLIFLFLTGIFFPFLNSVLHLVDDIPGFENRRLSQKPEFDIEHLDPFPEKYNAYYNDTFNLRNRLILWYNYFNIQVFNQSPVKSVIIGKDKWLFLSGEELDSYMGRNRFTEEELNRIAQELRYRADYLAARGTKFYFMIVPCKISVYSDKVGYQYYRSNPQTWGEQLNEYLSKYTTLNLVDIFDTLRKYKQPNNIYFKLDNHWNDLGAFYAARQAVLHMKKDFPGLETLQLSDFKINTTISTDGNINKMFGNLDMFKEYQVSLMPRHGFKAQDAELANYPVTPGFAYGWEYEKAKEIKGSDKPSLLIISDSFGGSIFPFLAESFRKTVKIWDAWQYKLNEDIVDKEQPDAMLLMIDEPILHKLLVTQHLSNPALKK